METIGTTKPVGLIATSSGRETIPIPAGVYLGRCYSVVDLGRQFNPKFDNVNHQIIITWEVPKVRIDIEKDGEKKSMPRVISQTYTLSLNEKANLRRLLESWRGKPFSETELRGFDLKSLVGKPCQIQVLNKTSLVTGKVQNRVGAVLPLQEGSKAPPAENPTLFFSLANRNLSDQLPDSMPKWIQKLVLNSEEMQGIANEPAVPLIPAGPATSDDMPAWDINEGEPTQTKLIDEDDLPF